VGGKELAGSNQLQAALERVSQGGHLRRRSEDVPAWPGSDQSRLAEPLPAGLFVTTR
jgi:hypothetical protein